MQQIVQFCVIFFACAFAAANANDGTGQCPGGYEDGTLVDIGEYWYECREAKMVPKGCKSPNGQRVDIAATFDKDDQRMQCVQGADGFLTTVIKACLHNGQERQIGAQWDDGTLSYVCAKNGPNGVLVKKLGCVDAGRNLKFDEKVAKGDFVYQCKQSADGSPHMNVVGCVKDGRKYAIGETFETDRLWYTCTNTGAKCVGCVHDGRRMKDGDRYTDKDVEYRCAVDGENTGLVPFSCIQHDENGVAVERRIGCFWIEGQYEYTCKRENGDKTAVKVQMRCNHKMAQGMFNVEPGCVRVVDQTAVGCTRSSDGQLSVRTYPADQADRLPGLRRC